MRGTEVMTGYTREEWIMDWLAQNWFWVVIALFAGMHFVGGGCGGQGAHGGRKAPDDGPSEKPQTWWHLRVPAWRNGTTAEAAVCGLS
jgi:hypothetical protein